MYNNYRYISAWQQNENVDDIIADLHNYDSVIIDAVYECEFNILFNDRNGFDKIAEYCRQHDMPITLIGNNIYRNPTLVNLDKVNTIDVTGYWFYLGFVWVADEKLCSNDININQPVEHLFVSLNNRAKWHRCMMMDILAKYDLIDKGAIAWQDNKENMVSYPYQYWTAKKINLDAGYNPTKLSIPKEVNNAFMQLVAESSTDVFCITEKTSLPFFYNKLFLVVSNKGFHNTLKDMGFRLYDKVFDYSFDNLDNLEDRIEGIVQNIDRYKNHSFTELQHIIKENEEDIRFNRKLALEYAFDKAPIEIDNYPALLIETNNDIKKNAELIKKALRNV